jgi:hypothetical protein
VTGLLEIEFEDLLQVPFVFDDQESSHMESRLPPRRDVRVTEL